MREFAHAPLVVGSVPPNREITTPVGLLTG